MKDLQFPVGISNFEKIREGGYYYIDKTNLISELLSGGIAEVTLITRPRRAVVILDEYDVPIAKASSNGYYSQMLDVMRAMMSTTLKDNTSLDFAVITGCLKIAKRKHLYRDEQFCFGHDSFSPVERILWFYTGRCRSNVERCWS